MNCRFFYLVGALPFMTLTLQAIAPLQGSAASISNISSVLRSRNTVACPVTLESAVQGAVLAGAIGDALGKITEFKSIEHIKALYGQQGVQGFQDFKRTEFWYDQEGNAIAPYTDDTAMARIVLSVLLEARAQMWDCDTTMGILARAYVQDMAQHRGWAYYERAPGQACLKAVSVLKNRIDNKETGKPLWWAAGASEAGGCGSVMRAHPFGLVFADDAEKAATWAAHDAKITHGHSMACAASAAMAAGIAYAIQGKDKNSIIDQMITVAARYDEKTALKMRKAVMYAKNTGKLSEEVFEEFLGWAADDAIAGTVYIFIKNAEDVKSAIRMGVNTTGDSDSLASMAGALVGAHMGVSQLPSEWLSRVEGSQDLAKLSQRVAVMLAHVRLQKQQK